MLKRFSNEQLQEALPMLNDLATGVQREVDLVVEELASRRIILPLTKEV